MSPSSKKLHHRYSLSTEFLVVMIFIFSISSIVTIVFENIDYKENIENIYNTKTKTIATLLSNTLGESLIARDRMQLDSFLKQILKEDGVVKATIFDNSQKIISSYSISGYEKVNAKSLIITERIIHYGNNEIGKIEIAIDLNLIPGLSFSHIMRHVLENLVQSGLMMLILIIYFRRSVSNPIDKMKNGINKIRKGSFGETIELSTNNELSDLANAINDLSASLETTELHKRNALLKLQESNDELKKATQAKTQFVANMSHEIRTPLTSIFGFSELLLGSDISERETHDYITSIYNSSKHLHTIVDEILDFSKIEAGKLEIHLKTINLFDFIHEIESIVKIQVENKHLDFELTTQFPIPKEITTDPVRLRQVVLNLCSNAIKFTASGFIHVMISYSLNDNSLRIEIHDSGIGIEDKEVTKIFHPFMQADESTERLFGGTGLGLAISRQLANMLGGDIEVNSIVGEGSRFQLRIDTGKDAQNCLLSQSPEETTVSRKVGALEKHKNALEGIHCLIVDDAKDIQLIIKTYMKKLGCRTTIANNGQDAVDMVSKERFDIIIMDKQMPKLNGLAATKQIRELGFSGPILALTADALPRDGQKFLEAGCDAYLTKPINVNEFVAHLMEFKPRLKIH